MKKKKKNWIWKNRWIYLGIIIVLSVYILIKGYYNSETQWCSRNSDKCVCEQTDYYHFNSPDWDGVVGCDEFRKKTQAELDIDDCNSNPREDERCFCKQWDIPFCKIGGAEVKDEVKKCSDSRPKTEC